MIENRSTSKSLRDPFEGRFAEHDNLSPQAARILQHDHPARAYIIFFTARSGSTWLSDLLESTGAAGNPREWFNPNQLRGRIKGFGEVTARTYVDLIQKYQQSQHTFGVEITFPQYKTFSKYVDLLDRLPNAKVIYLRRMNYVLQAISLYRATSTQVFHVKAGQEVRAVRSPEPKTTVPQYNGGEIKQWCVNILHQEWRLQRLFEERELQPLRITYESLVGNPTSVVGEILSFVRRGDDLQQYTAQSGHQKLGSEESIQWAQRFVEEYKEFVEYWDFFRGNRQIGRDGSAASKSQGSVGRGLFGLPSKSG